MSLPSRISRAHAKYTVPNKLRYICRYVLASAFIAAFIDLQVFPSFKSISQRIKFASTTTHSPPIMLAALRAAASRTAALSARQTAAAATARRLPLPLPITATASPAVAVAAPGAAAVPAAAAARGPFGTLGGAVRFSSVLKKRRKKMKKHKLRKLRRRLRRSNKNL